MNIETYDNYMFDLYGTLIDIHTDEHADATWDKWCGWLTGEGVKIPSRDEMREDFFTRDTAARAEARANWGFACPEIDVINIYRAMFKEYGNSGHFLTDKFLSEAGYAFRAASREYMRLFEGVEEFLTAIRSSGRHAYILSNAQRCYTWPEICCFGLEKMVEDVLISSDYRCMKPDAAFFNAMIDKHSLNRETTVMIGDSHENDYEGALAAGLNAIWLGPDNPAGRFYHA